jgi:hypothetical protein
MHWNSLADFLAMGSHGLYVWGSVAGDGAADAGGTDPAAAGSEED